MRASAVCDGPSQILQVLSWFTHPRVGDQGADGRAPMPVCRIKNKFAFAKEELVGGCVPH